LTSVLRLKIRGDHYEVRYGAIAAVLFAAALPAGAATSLYTTTDSATAACGADEVVWVDLDRGKFYHKSQDKFAKATTAAMLPEGRPRPVSRSPRVSFQRRNAIRT